MISAEEAAYWRGHRDSLPDDDEVTVTTNDFVEQACITMHDAYEKAAVGAGWETNPESRKPWADVPESNKVTMRAAVGALLSSLDPFIDTRRRTLVRDIEHAIGYHSAENLSNTPGFLLAEFLEKVLVAGSVLVSRRDKWYGVTLEPGGKDAADLRAQTAGLRMNDGWLPFGWHASYTPVPELEFDGQDEAGDPEWERVKR